MTRHRVLHLIHRINIGGAETQLLSLLRAMDRQGFDHRVGLFAGGGQLLPEYEELGLPIENFGFRHRRGPASLYRLVRYLRREQIDVLHMHIYSVGAYGRLAAAIAGVPVRVFTEHSDVNERTAIERAFERLCGRFIDLKITVSRLQAEASRRVEGYPAEKLLTIPNSVVLDDYQRSEAARDQLRRQFGYDDGHIVIGNVSTMRQQKRLDRLIALLPTLLPELPQLRLLLVGGGSEYENLVNQARRSGVEDQVLFTGPRRDVRDLLMCMDLYAIVSDWEGMPINLLEAMAAGLPIVSSRVGAIGDLLVHGESGLLHEESDLPALEANLRTMATDAALRARLGQRAALVASAELSAEVNASRILEQYERLLAAATK